MYIGRVVARTPRRSFGLPASPQVSSMEVSRGLPTTAGRLRLGREPVSQDTYDLAQAPQALAALVAEHTQGKLAIHVR